MTRIPSRRAGLAGIAALLALAAGCTPPPAAPAPPGARLAGEVSGWLSYLGGPCPTGQNFRRVLTLQVEAPEPSELIVDVCEVNTTAHGGAPARGGFELRTPDGTLQGTATGSWGWSYKDVLNVELDVSIARGELWDVNGSFQLHAEVERFDPIDSVSGELTALD